MQNDSIVITAKLDVKVSEGLILNDLETIQGNLEKNPLQINCKISDTAIKNMQSQLSSVTKGLTLDVGAVNTQSIQHSINEAAKNQGVKINVSTEIDKNVINKDVDAIKKLFQLGLKGNTLTEFRQELKPLLQEFADAYKSFDTERLQSSFQKVLDFIDRTKNETTVLDEALKQAQTSLRDLLSYEGKVSIDNPTRGDLRGIFGGSDKQVEQALDTVFGKGQWDWSKTSNRMSHSGFDTIAQQFNIEANNLAEGIAGLYDQLSKPVPKGNIFDVLENETDMLNAIAGSLKLPTEIYEFIGGDIWATGKPMEGLKVEIQGVDSAMQSLATDATQTQTAVGALLSDINKYPNIPKITSGFSTDNSAQLERAKDDLNDFFQNIAKVEDSATRIKRAVSDTEGELTRFYVQVEKEDKSVETLTYALNEQGTAYEFLSKAIREADNSTDFRRKGLDVQKEIKTEKVNEFITQLKEANLYTGDLKTRADELKESISKVTDTNSMNKFLDDFDIAKAKFSAMKAESRSYNNSLKDTENYINKAVAALEKFSNSSVAKRNSNSADVISQTSTNANLVSQLKALSDSLGADKSTANIQRIRQEIDRLSPSIERATTDSQNLVRTLTDNRLSQDATKRLNNLTNQINTFANANKKAIESTRQMRSGVTFADEWKRITDALKSGNLDDNAIRQLTADFQNFKGEARSVGNVTNTVFTNMGGQIQMLMSRWLSLYAVIGKIKQMITYVIELDDAMTKLKRVTDETAEGYERFLEVAKKSAKETNTTLVDTVEQAAKWAKSGYDAATSAQLAKTSLIYSIVGDIDNDTAVSDLVTALRGFRLEAEDAMSIVDKLDALNNKYATDAKSLGEALTVSASAMANAGNDLDQTLALITGATEITQNAKETGQAIRTITMRIRGKLYASIQGNLYALIRVITTISVKG